MEIEFDEIAQKVLSEEQRSLKPLLEEFSKTAASRSELRNLAEE